MDQGIGNCIIRTTFPFPVKRPLTCAFERSHRIHHITRDLHTYFNKIVVVHLKQMVCKIHERRAEYLSLRSLCYSCGVAMCQCHLLHAPSLARAPATHSSLLAGSYSCQATVLWKSLTERGRGVWWRRLPQLPQEPQIKHYSVLTPQVLRLHT